ncbi:GNAT family N-acetyltransferase [Paenibacillus sp. LHD-38]|uniref:GNAT family N-acetyltransferase n=1 Tax=Paenibacillus sp. LHD-38 TaxID=3072143 RepID=UPI00280ECBB6|nr:GNAT family N-acetyltransferase [Paenibacillus sp. LHD-38]MDQ8737854.1 GNAT family N-acetyltransferase [Paenibacillus sp. LHD-38]
MIYELHPAEGYRLIKHLLEGCENAVVIYGVLEGNNLGKVYVDDPKEPKAAFIWAQNEMYYLIGGPSEAFYTKLERFIIEHVKPEAIGIGEDYFNLELITDEPSDALVERIFGNRLSRGERVPFSYQKEDFLALEALPVLPDGYELLSIDRNAMERDAEKKIEQEILKFWGTLEAFLAKGIGFCMFKENEVIGTCLSVYVSGSEYEIGINTYEASHRGKGLATAMAAAFIHQCIRTGGTPHWTTESFRKDSIAIARKLGFKQRPNYPVYFLAFENFKQ